MVNTYLAASAAVLSSSPSKKGIFSGSLSSVNEGIKASNLGRNVSLSLSLSLALSLSHTLLRTHAYIHSHAHIHKREK